VAETAADARNVMVEGPSGLLAIHPVEFRPKFEVSKRRLTWPNGAVAMLYNATEPDQLRGPQHDAAWCDELAKWRYAQETWDMLQFGLRLGERPKQAHHHTAAHPAYPRFSGARGPGGGGHARLDL
jgi:phage terminase large subunit-like protein